VTRHDKQKQIGEIKDEI